MSEIRSSTFQRVTGYQVVDSNNDKKVDERDRIVVNPGEAPLQLRETTLNKLFELHGGTSATSAKGALRAPAGKSTKQALKYLDKRLEKVWDLSSPFVITNREAKEAHTALMRMSPRQFNEVLAKIPTEQLNNYLLEILDPKPWDLHSNQTHPLSEFVLKLAVEGRPGVAGRFVNALSVEARMELTKALATLPDAQLHQRFRKVLGEEAYALLVQGSQSGKRDNIIGRALVEGRYPARNITDEFKSLYNRAKPTKKAFNEPIELPNNKNDFQYFFLEGLFGQNLPGYLEANKEAMVAAGINKNQIQYAEYNTGGSTYLAAANIAEQLVARYRATGQKAVLITHSMGGRHAKALLGSTRAELQKAGLSAQQIATIFEARELVAGNLLMQPALNAQIAQDIRTSDVMKGTFEAVLFLAGGTKDSFVDMSDRSLGEPFPGDRYPTVVLASDGPGSHSFLGAAIEHYYSGFYGVPSDGAVPTAEQIAVDGADLIYLPNAGDHMRPGLNVEHAVRHFSVQLYRGKPDEVLLGVMTRIGELCPIAGVVIDKLKDHLDDEATRKWAAAQLEMHAPAIDAYLRKERLKAGVETMDPKRTTQAALALLLGKLD